MSNTNWMIGAMCYGKPTAWWFPKKGDRAEQVFNFRVAKKICSTCSCKKKCLEYGKNTSSYGMWGGVVLQGRNRYGTKDTALDMSSV